MLSLTVLPLIFSTSDNIDVFLLDLELFSFNPSLDSNSVSAHST
jgi:hypothetical protein